MSDFIFRFLISNLFISGIIVLLFLFKYLLRHMLTSRLQFHLWYVMLGLLSVPFLPFPIRGVQQFFLWIYKLKNTATSHMEIITENSINVNTFKPIGAIQDFALSVSLKTPTMVGNFLFGLWLIGIFVMFLLVIISRRHFHLVKQSALPLQNKDVHILYKSCIDELNITVNIPIYSTAFLKSPVIVGLFQPCIYLPIYVISDCPASKIRYMLLHELQHFRHKDALAGYLMVLAGILYWFHPLVWYALQEMHSDREVACDAAVLEFLKESDYKDYGNTLLELAEKMSLAPFPFVVGISGSMKQMQKRIINIASYQKPSSWKKAKGYLFFCAITILLWGLSPMLSTYAADQNHYQWDTSSKTISIVDLSSHFHGYSGSFVLYNLKDDAWNVYNMEQAQLRISPCSTYKIYNALLGLEKHIITPQNSFMVWDGTDYPYKAWNADQDLYSAMQSSVNWYFQNIDKQLSISSVKHYIQEIGYGNQQIPSDLSSYWMQSCLKISPIEQVELLIDLYQNRFDFAQENIDAVKKSICLSSSEQENFYGKTGTGCINGQDINGWFIGFIETDNHICFFATNIQSDSYATGSKAAEITLSILSEYFLDAPHS